MADDRRSIRDTRLRWADDAGTLVNINTSILTMSVSFTSDMASQITLTVHDPNGELARNRFFNITRTVLFSPENTANFNAGGRPQIPGLYSGLTDIVYPFEVAAASVATGPGRNFIWTIELRPKPIQQMKRDKNPKSYKGKGSDYVMSVCNKYGLNPLIERTSKSVTINGASGDRRADSVWDVLSNLASEAKFRLFETQGTLVFASPKFLLGLYGSSYGTFDWVDPTTNRLGQKSANYIPLRWPSTSEDILRPMEPPTFRKSDNDPLEAQGSVSLIRESAMGLRPGMTLYYQGIEMFSNFYLIDSVEYDFLGNSPVQVSFRTPEREEKNVQDFEIGFIYPPNYRTWGEG